MKHEPFSNLFWWVLLGLLWLAAILLGVMGWSQYSSQHQSAYDVADDLYLTIQLISMNSGAPEPPVPLFLNISRFAFPLLTLLTAIKAFLDLFRQQIRTIRMRGLRGHVVICGLSRKGMLLATRFHQQGDEVVVIEQDEDNPWLESCRGLGIHVLLGDASDPTILNMASAARARGLFAVCDHDGINADIALQAQRLARGRDAKKFPQPLMTLAHITDPQLCDLLRVKESEPADPNFRMELFNVYERAAQRLLNEYPAWNAETIRAGREPRILLIGLGRMGENILTHAASEWRATHPNPKKRLRVTFIDRHALRKAESLVVRYPDLAKDCLLTPLQMEIRSPEFERAAFLVDDHGKALVDRVYVCVDDDSLGLHAGLTLHRLVQQNKDVLIVIRMTEENGLANLLEDRKSHNGDYRNLVPFGYLNHTCTPDLLK